MFPLPSFTVCGNTCTYFRLSQAKDKMPTPAGWTNYLADLATDGYWAGEWEAAAEARWHNIEIVLIDPNEGLFLQYNEGAARRVVVCRVNGNHFDAIVPNGGAHHDAAAAPAHAGSVDGAGKNVFGRPSTPSSASSGPVAAGRSRDSGAKALNVFGRPAAARSRRRAWAEGGGGGGANAGGCCITCAGGKACGDACIAREKVCSVPKGCACDAGK